MRISLFALFPRYSDIVVVKTTIHIACIPFHVRGNLVCLQTCINDTFSIPVTPTTPESPPHEYPFFRAENQTHQMNNRPASCRPVVKCVSLTRRLQSLWPDQGRTGLKLLESLDVVDWDAERRRNLIAMSPAVDLKSQIHVGDRSITIPFHH